jgi:hypothetical protein
MDVAVSDNCGELVFLFTCDNDIPPAIFVVQQK